MKNIIIYATCQGVPVRDLLLQSNEIKNNYNIEYHSNFSAPGNSQFSIEPEKLNNCDIFLFHPTKNFTEDYISSILPNRTLKLVLPYITFSAYWPDFSRAPNRPLGVSSDHPYGKIPYRSEILDQLATCNLSGEGTIKEYVENQDAIGLEALKCLNSDLDYLRKLDQMDGPFFVKEYIEENFRDRQLFKMFNHPKNEIYLLLVNQLLQYLDIPKLQASVASRISGHAEQNLPIHPATAKHLHLNFYKHDMKYIFLGKEYSLEDFIKEYLSFL